MIQVPVIDLTLARAGGPADREHVARQMDAACQEIGFFAITGHGVPDGRAVHSPVLSGEIPGSEVCEDWAQRRGDRRPFGVILPANDCAVILPSRTMNVSVASSYTLSAVSAVHTMYA